MALSKFAGKYFQDKSVVDEKNITYDED